MVMNNTSIVYDTAVISCQVVIINERPRLDLWKQLRLSKEQEQKNRLQLSRKVYGYFISELALSITYLVRTV
jgi:hypothetical protein